MTGFLLGLTFFMFFAGMITVLATPATLRSLQASEKGIPPEWLELSYRISSGFLFSKVIYYLLLLFMVKNLEPLLRQGAFFFALLTLSYLVLGRFERRAILADPAFLASRALRVRILLTAFLEGIELVVMALIIAFLAARL